MTSLHRALADVLLVVHFALVVFIVGGLVTIVVGNLASWRWVNAPLFRGLHLAAIGVVVAESWLGIACPLTTLEVWLRGGAGAAGIDDAGFVAHWVGRMLYFDAPAWVFGVAYTVFGALVAAAWWRWPPRRRWR